MQPVVPFVDLTLSDYILDQIDDAIKPIITNSKFILGESVEKFEDLFSAYCGAKYGVGVSSGTAALHIALVAAGIGIGDKVITVPNTYVATVEAILYTGADVTFVDVDPDTALMDIDLLEDAIDKNTKAIIPVHLYGQMANMPEIIKTACKHDIKVIEDACQCHGAAYYDADKYIVEHPGANSLAACFSFYPTKNLGAWGDGGMIVTNSKNLYEKLLILRDHGQSYKNIHTMIGYNYRLDAIQAAVLSVKLQYLNMWNSTRARIAAQYDELLPPSIRQIMKAKWTCYHSYHLYVIKAKDRIERSSLQGHLDSYGISHAIHYPLPIHLQKMYEYTKSSMPVSESLAEQVLSLPMYPGLTVQDIEYICNAICEYYDGETHVKSN